MVQTMEELYVSITESETKHVFSVITRSTCDRAKMVQTMEELHDVYQHFLLYYGSDIPRMKAQQRQARKKAKEEDGEGGEEGEEEVQEPEGLKQATRKTGYSICVQAGLGTYQELVTYIVLTL